MSQQPCSFRSFAPMPLIPTTSSQSQGPFHNAGIPSEVHRDGCQISVWLIYPENSCNSMTNTHWFSWWVWPFLCPPVVHSDPQHWQPWPGSDTRCQPSGLALWSLCWRHLHCRPCSMWTWSLVAPRWCKRSEGILRHSLGPSTEGQQKSLWCCSPLTDPWVCLVHLFKDKYPLVFRNCDNKLHHLIPSVFKWSFHEL